MREVADTGAPDAGWNLVITRNLRWALRNAARLFLVSVQVSR